MILTTLEGYAIKSLIYIASKKDRRATVSEIAQNNNVSFPYILRICSMLREHHILESEKGRSGGYIMVRDPKDISVLEIIQAVKRNSIEVKCEFGLKTSKCKPAECISMQSLEYLKSRLDDFLSKITLQDLLERSLNYGNFTNTGN
ncbi:MULTISPECIES: RrF2 family transcriptional regulator [Caldisericum]|jgi:Rrf2 family protein|uniref:RrF2 family transcriptional regulator n=1 Tax=Caldisericum TaxID=693074 RepID=UPI003C729811